MSVGGSELSKAKGRPGVSRFSCSEALGTDVLGFRRPESRAGPVTDVSLSAAEQLSRFDRVAAPREHCGANRPQSSDGCWPVRRERRTREHRDRCGNAHKDWPENELWSHALIVGKPSTD